MKTKCAKPRGKKFTQRRQWKMSNDFLCWHNLAVFPKKKTKQKTKKDTWSAGHQEDPVDYWESSIPTEFSKQNSPNVIKANTIKDIKYHTALRVFHFRLQTDKCYNLLNKSKCKNLCSIYNKIWVYISLQSIETICCRSGWLIVPVSRHTRWHILPVP